MKYSQMLFDCVLTERGGQWARASIVNYIQSQSPDFVVGLSAGGDDARDFINSKEAKALARLGKVFVQEEGLAT